MPKKEMNMVRQINASNEPTEACATLGGQIARWTAGTNIQETPVKGLTLYRFDAPTEPVSSIQEPSVCLIAQGTKRVHLGEEAYDYDQHTFLVTSVGLPIVAQITGATSDKPYLGLRLLLDRRELAQMMVDSNLPLDRIRQPGRGLAVGTLEAPLRDAFQRLVGLMATPEEIPIMAPLIKREILFRLLLSDQGERLRQIATTGSHSHQIARALDWLKDNFTESLRVDDLASQAGMSSSSFRQHFRSVTSMSPLQYQKWLRLNEARRLMLTEQVDAATSAFQVGYESPSQFSREYSRLFGAPPLRDIKKLHREVRSREAASGV